MPSDEVRAALNECRDMMDGRPDDFDWINVSVDCARDLFRLAKAYAAERDPTPISGEWLEKIGGMDDGTYGWDFCFDNRVLHVSPGGGIAISDEHGDTAWITRTTPTRGQVLRLLDVLGREVQHGG